MRLRRANMVNRFRRTRVKASVHSNILNFPRTMHAVIDQVIPPNVVNYSRKFSAKLEGDAQKSNMLACVKTNAIEVYILPSSGPLRLFSKHNFASRIESIEVLVKPDSDSDLIFMAFSDCKVTIMLFVI